MSRHAPAMPLLLPPPFGKRGKRGKGVFGGEEETRIELEQGENRHFITGRSLAVHSRQEALGFASQGFEDYWIGASGESGGLPVQEVLDAFKSGSAGSARFALTAATGTGDAVTGNRHAADRALQRHDSFRKVETGHCLSQCEV